MTISGIFPALLLLQFGGGGAMTPFVIQLVAIFAIFYFLLIRPQQAQKKKHETALKALKRGDQVVTSGGIIGEVVHVKEDGSSDTTKTLEDAVTIRSGESKLVVERGRIARIGGGTTSAPKE